ncbi:MAG: INTEGRAL MEMBRANE PROTEIN (Rhomboid family), partial [uncultured Nocardioidaceae bacterium]
ERTIRRRRHPAPSRHSHPAAPAPDGALARPAGDRRGPGGHLLHALGVHRRLDRPVVVRQPRVRRGVQQGARDPGAAVRALRRAHGRLRRAQRRHRLPPPAQLPADGGGPGARPLPRRAGPAAQVGGPRDRRAAGAHRRRFRLRTVALVPAVAPRAAVRHRRPLLQEGHRVLRLRPAVVALRRELRAHDGRAGAGGGGGRPLPVRRHPAA